MGSISVERDGLWGCAYPKGGDAEVTEDDGVTIGARRVLAGVGISTGSIEIYTVRSCERRGDSFGRCWGRRWDALSAV